MGWGMDSMAAWDQTGLNGYQLTDIDAFHLCMSDGGVHGDGSAQQLRVAVAFVGHNLKDPERSGNEDHTHERKLFTSFCATQ